MITSRDEDRSVKDRVTNLRIGVDLLGDALSESLLLAALTLQSRRLRIE